MLLLFAPQLGVGQGVGSAAGVGAANGMAVRVVLGVGYAAGTGAANGVGAASQSATPYTSVILVHGFIPLPSILPVPNPILCITQVDARFVFRMLVMDSQGSPIDLTEITLPMQFVFQVPDGTNITKTAAYTTNGVDGQTQCLFGVDEATQPGLWRAQLALVFIGGGFSGLTNAIEAFRVAANIR